MPSKHNIALVEGLSEALSASPIVVVTKFGGISANASDVLRTKLAEGGVKLNVVRNTLAKVAAEQAKRASVVELLGGQIAFLFSEKDDIATVAKTIDRAFKDMEEAGELELVGAVHNENTLNAKEMNIIAKLPSYEQLVAKMLGSLNTPVTRFVSGLNGILVGLLTVLNGVATEKAKA